MNFLLNSLRLFVELKLVYAGVFFAQLVCGALFMAASLFQMDTVGGKTKLSDFIFPRSHN